MRESVRLGFVPFTAPLEGVVRWMYLDVKQLVTTGIGNLIDPMSYALAIPFVKPDGSPASQAEITQAWLAVKGGGATLAQQGYRAAARYTTIRLTDEGVEHVVGRKLDENDRYLQKRFPDFDSWPADAQLATHSMSWACGPAFHFPALEAALRNRDFLRASKECHINEAGNPGIVPRNRANVALYVNAARVEDFKLDPEELHYPDVVPDVDPVPETLPEGPVVIDGGTVHPDVDFVPPDPPDFDT